MSAPGWAEERARLESWFDSVWPTASPAAISITGLVLTFGAVAKTVKRATGDWIQDGLQIGECISFSAGALDAGNRGPFKIADIQTNATTGANDTLVLVDSGDLMLDQAGVAAVTAVEPVPWYPMGQIEQTPPNGEPWIEMAIIGGVGSQIELGAPAIFRHPQMVQFRISTPIATGATLAADAGARLIADALDSLWANQHFQTLYGVIRCRVPDYKAMGLRDGRFEGIFSVPFLRDEQRSIPPIVQL